MHYIYTHMYYTHIYMAVSTVLSFHKTPQMTLSFSYYSAIPFLRSLASPSLFDIPTPLKFSVNRFHDVTLIMI